MVPDRRVKSEIESVPRCVRRNVPGHVIRHDADVSGLDRFTDLAATFSQTETNQSSEAKRDGAANDQDRTAARGASG